MILRPPIPTRTAPRFPYTTLFQSPRSAPRSASLDLTDQGRLVRAAPSGCPRRHRAAARVRAGAGRRPWRTEEHTSELQSLMRISYAVFCLKKKKNDKYNITRK